MEAIFNNDALMISLFVFMLVIIFALILYVINMHNADSNAINIAPNYDNDGELIGFSVFHGSLYDRIDEMDRLDIDLPLIITDDKNELEVKQELMNLETFINTYR